MGRRRSFGARRSRPGQVDRLFLGAFAVQDLVDLGQVRLARVDVGTSRRQNFGHPTDFRLQRRRTLIGEPLTLRFID